MILLTLSKPSAFARKQFFFSFAIPRDPESMFKGHITKIKIIYHTTEHYRLTYCYCRLQKRKTKQKRKRDPCSRDHSKRGDNFCHDVAKKYPGRGIPLPGFERVNEHCCSLCRLRRPFLVLDSTCKRAEIDVGVTVRMTYVLFDSMTRKYVQLV